MRLQVVAQVLQQWSVFGEALHQDEARAVQRRLGVGHAGVVALLGGEGRLQVFARLFLGVEHSVGQQRIGQRQQPGFQRDLRLGAAFWFVRQVQVFQAGLVFGMTDRVQQLRRHLVLLIDRRDDRGAPFLQLAQVAQALFQQPQLHIVQLAGRLLAVARDERHGRTLVEQRNGGGDLGGFGGNFEGEALFDGWQHEGLGD